MFWFAVIQVTQWGGIIRCPHPHVNHNAPPKLFMAPYFIYDFIFPCHLKVRKSRFCRQKQSCQAFHGDGAAFISHTGWESCGMWGSYSADKPYHLYIASIMLRSRSIFKYIYLCKTFVIWENSGSRPALHVIKLHGELEWRKKQSGTKYFLRKVEMNCYLGC